MQKTTHSYHGKRASVYGSRSTVHALVLCVIDLRYYLCCCVLKASIRAHVVGGQGGGVSTSPRCYAPPLLFFLEVGRKKGQYGMYVWCV